MSPETTAADEAGRARLDQELVAALGRVPELAGLHLSLTPLSGGITNRNFLVDGRRRRPSAG